MEEMNSKQRKIRNYEMGEQKQTIGQRIMTKVIENLLIEIENIHLTFEGINTWLNVQYVFGIDIQSILLYSTNNEWKRMFITERSLDHFKIAEINKLNCYHYRKNAQIKKNFIIENLTTQMHLTLSDKEESFPITSSILLSMLKMGISQHALIDIKSMLQQQKLF